jgi:MFS transporter, PCFT/HCP family, solute carrier family 46 (folate transporter), member 1
MSRNRTSGETTSLLDDYDRNDDPLDPLLEEGEQETLVDASEDEDEITKRSRLGRLLDRCRPKSPRKTVVLITFLKFYILTIALMLLLPMYRLIEDMVCREYFEKDLVDEEECKVDAVQRKLAYVTALSALIGGVVSKCGPYHPFLGGAFVWERLIVVLILGGIVTFPFGILGDKIGRKPLFLIAISGLFCSFLFAPYMLYYFRNTNPYYLLFGNLWLLCGGGVPVAISTLFAMTADLSTGKDRYVLDFS